MMNTENEQIHGMQSESALQGIRSAAEYMARVQLPMDQARHLLERELIMAALAECNGNQKQAAARLGVHRNTLERDMKKLGIPLKTQVCDEQRRMRMAGGRARGSDLQKKAAVREQERPYSIRVHQGR
jgi:hypothetical protein